MNDAITGLWVALATPLTEAGAVDHGAMLRHVRFLLERGCDGVVPFGTTGEGTSFSAHERLAAVEALLAGGIPAAKIGLGAGYPAIPDAIALTKAALSLGLVHVLVLPPYFYRDVSETGIVDAFAAILDGVGDDRLRATLYHIPQTSGVALPPAAVAALRGRYGRLVAGVKDSSGDFAHSGPSGRRRRRSRSASATRPISAGRSPRAASGRSAAWPTSFPAWCGRCSPIPPLPSRCGQRSA